MDGPYRSPERLSEPRNSLLSTLGSDGYKEGVRNDPISVRVLAELFGKICLEGNVRTTSGREYGKEPVNEKVREGVREWGGYH